MESLLSLSFDNLSSRDHTRIRKGLRQIEGLLAQICLSSSRLSPHKRTKSEISPDAAKRQAEAKALRELRKDAAFREFFRLQEGFRWNVASRLTATLERLMGHQSATTTNALLQATLTLLQGLLLLHPASRTLFTREDYMNLLLDLLDPSNPPNIQSQALLVLVATLLDNPGNTRVFEQVDGLLTVTSLFKSRSTSKEVKMRTLEFLYFYLMPESLPSKASSAPNTIEALQRSPSKKLQAHARTHSGEMDLETEIEGAAIKTTEDKQKLLGRHLNNVAELVRDLQENAVFSATAAAG